MTLSPQQDILKKFIQNFIYNACNYHFETLENIYHQNLVIVMINEKSEVTRLNREQNMEIFKKLAQSNSPPINTDTEFNYIEVNDTEAQVIVTRKMDITGRKEKIVFSLYLVYESERWQIYREMAFVQPDV